MEAVACGHVEGAIINAMNFSGKRACCQIERTVHISRVGARPVPGVGLAARSNNSITIPESKTLAFAAHVDGVGSWSGVRFRVVGSDVSG